MNCQTRCEGVEVQAEVLVGDDLEHLAPDRRRVREVAPAWPLIARKDHRAVLDRDLDVVLGGEFDDWRPHLPEVFEVVCDRAMLVAADERADDADLQAFGGFDHAAEVVVRRVPRGAVGIEVVGVVRKRGDLEVVPPQHVADSLGLEVVDVDVRDAGVASALATGGGPARDLESLEAVGVRPLGDLFQRQIGERYGEKAQLHRGTSTQRPPLEMRATASQTSMESWPSTKVG